MPSQQNCSTLSAAVCNKKNNIHSPPKAHLITFRCVFSFSYKSTKMQKIVHFSPMQQTPSFIDITPILLSTEQTIAHLPFIHKYLYSVN